MAAKRAQKRRAPYNLLVCVYDAAVCHNADFFNVYMHCSRCTFVCLQVRASASACAHVCTCVCMESCLMLGTYVDNVFFFPVHF